MNVFEATTLGSVLGAPGDPNGGIFIGKLSGISGAKMRKRLLYPTYKNSTGKNVRVQNALNEEHLYNENCEPLTESDIEKIMEEFGSKTAFKGGAFVKIQPKCAAFPYCSQGAVDKPIKLISGSKEGMCEGCYDYCKTIAETAGRTAEWVAEGFRQNTLKRLEELTVVDQKKINQLLTAIEPTVEPRLMDKIKDTVHMRVIDPFTTFEDILNFVKRVIPHLGNISESIELTDNKPTKTIKEMKIRNLTIERKKAIMENVMKSVVAESANKKLQSQGFLPSNEELDGITMKEAFDIVVEDEETLTEMFSVLMKECRTCNKWVNENEEDVFEPEEESPEETPANPESEVGGDEVNPAETPDANTPPPAQFGDQVGVESGGELGAALEAITAAQSADDDAAVFGYLTKANMALQKALSAINVKMDTEIPTATPQQGEELPADQSPESEADSFAQSIDENVDGGAPVKKAGTRKTLDADFIDKLNIFKSEYLDDLKWGSLSTLYNLRPEVLHQIHEYLTPASDENGVGFVQRLTNLNNDPTGINRMMFNLMNPSKRGYLIQNASKHDPQFLDSLEDLLNDMWAKYQAILAMVNGTNYENPDAEDDGPESDDNSAWTKDDFAADFERNNDVDSLAAKAAKRASNTKVPTADIDLGDQDDEEDLLESVVKELREGAQIGLSAEVLAANHESAAENLQQAKEAVESQKTEDQKIDELKNQKFEATEAQNAVGDKLHGMNNNLDLDYDIEPSKEYKSRVQAQASGTAPADHANVDHNSTGGEKLIDSAKKRAPETEKQYTSIPDATIVKDDEKYEVTTAVNEDLERMKKLISFDVTKKKEHLQRKTMNEEKFLIDKVAKKKFL